MVPLAQSRACFGRHRARGHRPAQGDFSALSPGQASRKVSPYPIAASHCQTVQCGTDRSSAGTVCGCFAASILTGAITPLRDGVGPMTIMSLMHNTLIAAAIRSGLGVPQLRQM
ncbi:hypothetical protein HFO98_15310 [Rhizobium leguminosarum]|uniref:hypothetical protein n=1 Tax=Rhizobium leguminosarum TaxID=384 RepID=UPI001C93EAA2|nr:hypothetical protein [Rhizobium leguminosarum]MBY5409816.1 hypothetical protein [Rhizobium leguminosarum]